MLFHSYFFIFLFLPITFISYFICLRFLNQNLAFQVLVIASLIFYAWFNIFLTLVLLSSIVFNFYICRYIIKNKKKIILVFVVFSNLLLLIYFKYSVFLLSQFSIEHDLLLNIILPIGISFFTFQQIAYCVDCFKGKVSNSNFTHYALFISFFPQLIAGPIVRYEFVVPQYKEKIYSIISKKFIIGINLFIIGLFKKTFIADSVAFYTEPFNYVSSGGSITFFESWLASIAYTFQIYFDFSGYCDMAIGLGLMFGINLPVNFKSPYKSSNFIEFWRCWHITLSEFLKNHIYIPLGGNKNGKLVQSINIFITMLLGGFWHGANWTFLAWGAMHACIIFINHIWLTIRLKHNISPLKKFIAVPLTFLMIIFTWVLFRAESINDALHIYQAMLGFNGFALPSHYEGTFGFLREYGIQFPNKEVFIYGIDQLFYYIALLVIVWFFPSNAEIFNLCKVEVFSNYLSVRKIKWSPTLNWSTCISILFIIGLISIVRLNEFIYFQF